MRVEDLRLLGLPPDSSLNDIRRAYRKLVLKHHPDVSETPDQHDVFLQIQSAYERLMQPEAEQKKQAESSVNWRYDVPRPQAPHQSSRQKFFRAITRLIYAPPLFILLLMLTPLFLMMAPIIPRLMEAARRRRQKKC